MNKKKPSEIHDFRGLLVRVVRLERTVSWSQTYVWTFSEGSCALFGTFRHSCGSALELYWPVYFRHRFRLLGFVWDWILYIKSASDRVYIQQRVLLPQRAAQKLRRINKEISAMTKKQQADLDDSQPAERRCLFDVLPFSSNACSFTRECNADFYNWRNIHCLQINAVCTVVNLLQGNISKVFKLCFRAVFPGL